ncbi:MAG TPA: hypothetical protein V6D28_14670 [Leptolyngbyaceae cyanobacterium]
MIELEQMGCISAKKAIAQSISLDSILFGMIYNQQMENRSQDFDSCRGIR